MVLCISSGCCAAMRLMCRYRRVHLNSYLSSSASLLSIMTQPKISSRTEPTMCMFGQGKPCGFGLLLNIYINRPVGRGAPDRRFLSQTSSIDFLIGQGFDFNKLFKEGVSYLLPSELDKLKEGLKERQENKRRLSQVDQSENLKVRVPEEQEEWLEKQMTAIEQFLKTGGQESFLMDKCNGFQRRLVYQV